jgi:TetR/AcrR family transcriptional repressor for divergent bdcA
MPRTGRPRSFDKEQAVEQAMRLFWERGYEATSLTELKAAMGGLSTASFYAAFGSKEALFRLALARYLATHGRVVAPLDDELLPPRDAIERTLRQSARMQTDPGHPQGCLVVVSTATCSPENRHIQAAAAAERVRNAAGFLACVSRAVAAGELRPDTDACALGAIFNTFLLGLTTQARDRVPLTTLDAAISGLMQVWHAHAVSPTQP